MVYCTSFLLIPACCGWLWAIPHFIKKVKAHKARRKLEMPKRMKASKARKKMKARKAHKKIKVRKAR